MSIAFVVAGVGATARGEPALAVCLPAGLALLGLPLWLFYLDRRWYPPISGFVLDNDLLICTFARDPVSLSHRADDVIWVAHRMRHGRTRGYQVKFRDGSAIYVCRSITNADELARVLQDSIGNRSVVHA
jgi:hypothetical protein